MRALEFIRDHVTFKLPYDFSYQMKNPKYCQYKNHVYIVCEWVKKNSKNMLT